MVYAAAYKFPASALKDLAKDPEVAYVWPDRPYVGNGQFHHVHSTITPTQINAPYAWGMVWMAPASGLP